MPFLSHAVGMEWMLKILFPKTVSPPTTLYMGLCNDTPVVGDTLSTLANEMSTNGYSRVALTANNTNFVVAEDTNSPTGYKVTFVGTFTASGGDIGPFTRWFLCTSADNTGVLLSSGDVAAEGASRTISDGDSFQQTAYIKFANAS